MDKETAPGQRLDSAEWNRLRKEVLSHDGHQCVNWGGTDISRSTPRRAARTGRDENKPTNLVAVCRSYHAGAHEENVYDPNRETENER